MTHVSLASLVVSTSLFTTAFATVFDTAFDTAFGADALTIRDIAPDTAFFVIGVDDVKGTWTRLESTGFGKLWNDASVAEEVKKFKEEIEKGLAEAAKDAGFQRDDLSWPSSLGAALVAELDEELGIPSVEFIFFADWGADAEKAAKVLDTLIAHVEKTSAAAGQKITAEEIRGRRVLVMPLDSDADAADGAGDEGEGDEGDAELEAMGMGLPEFGPKSMCLVSDKGRLLVSGSVASMGMLLSRVDGDHAKSAGETETFKSATQLAGGTQDLYAVFATKPAASLLAAVPQMMLFQPLLERVFGDIQAISVGLHANEGVFEQGFGVYMPNGKAGVLALVDAPTTPTAPSAMVPADAVTYMNVNVKFDQIVPVLDGIVAGLPAEQAEMVTSTLEMFRPAMTAAFAAMGPQVHSWSGAVDAENPLVSNSVTAIAMKNDKDSAAAVSDLLNLFPLGLQSRDFNGMTILSDEFAPFAVGIGGGALVFGSVQQVEQALRSVDAKGEAGLASNPQFAAALAAMSKDSLVAMGWTDFAQQFATATAAVTAAQEQLGAMSGVDEDAEIPGLGVGMENLSGLGTLMKAEAVKRCFGDATFDVRSLSNGFSSRYRIFPAATK